MALAAFEHKEDVEVVYRSFQLNMATESFKGKDIHQVIADKYHISYTQAKENNDRIIEAASEVGLNYRFDILKLNSTELAHEIAHFAKKKGKGKELVHRYFKGFTEILWGLIAIISIQIIYIENNNYNQKTKSKGHLNMPKGLVS